ncbi:MAG TPA: PEPxxWA-CTERM sorting domain-containing protein [Sphingomonas sp.]|jgi:hypothetical protein|nr:PEPxxWA-CTERM sorting domain-containing protein [Sphingomonas sp.]
MRKILVASLALGALASTANAATMVQFNAGTAPIQGNLSILQNFDGLAAGSSLGTNASVFSDSVSGIAARPAYNSTGNFGAVTTGGSYSVNFGPTNVFGFALGSLDTYNSLTLTYADGSTSTYDGGQIIRDMSFPSGDQISGDTNGRVLFRVTGNSPRIVGATFGSSGNSFEFDDLVVAGVVPEPAVWGLMIAGFGAVGFSRRRRTAVRTVTA